jgi:hypothetical protein
MEWRYDTNREAVESAEKIQRNAWSKATSGSEYMRREGVLIVIFVQE